MNVKNNFKFSEGIAQTLKHARDLKALNLNTEKTKVNYLLIFSQKNQNQEINKEQIKFIKKKISVIKYSRELWDVNIIACIINNKSLFNIKLDCPQSASIGLRIIKEEFNSKFDKIEIEIIDVKTQVTEVKTQLAEVKTQLAEVKTQLTEIMKSLNNINNKKKQK
jgi:hypothetical protein